MLNFLALIFYKYNSMMTTTFFSYFRSRCHRFLSLVLVDWRFPPISTRDLSQTPLREFISTAEKPSNTTKQLRLTGTEMVTKEDTTFARYFLLSADIVYRNTIPYILFQPVFSRFVPPHTSVCSTYQMYQILEFKTYFI